MLTWWRWIWMQMERHKFTDWPMRYVDWDNMTLQINDVHNLDQWHENRNPASFFCAEMGPYDILGMDVLFEELPEIVNLGVQESTRMLKHCFFLLKRPAVNTFSSTLMRPWSTFKRVVSILMARSSQQTTMRTCQPRAMKMHRTTQRWGPHLMMNRSSTAKDTALKISVSYLKITSNSPARTIRSLLSSLEPVDAPY